MRTDNRANDALRPVTLDLGFQPHADASVLIRMGGTHVACAVTVEESVPPHCKDAGKGWITAEYGMLPCATHSRGNREAVKGRSGRTYEIQRLIGRSLRMMVDLAALGERTLRVDCDVLNADGGTRCAAITASAVALREALAKLQAKGALPALPTLLPVAAVSVGIVNREARLDLDYAEDSAAEADANFVMTGDGRLVELQCTAEKRPFTAEEFEKMAELAARGIDTLIERFWSGA